MITIYILKNYNQIKKDENINHQWSPKFRSIDNS